MARLKKFFVVMAVLGFVFGLSGSVFAANTMKKININKASAAQLSILKGVDKKLAESIVKYRDAHGPFKTVKDLERVKGVTPAIIKKNEARLTVSGQMPAPAPKASAQTPKK